MGLLMMLRRASYYRTALPAVVAAVIVSVSTTADGASFHSPAVLGKQTDGRPDTPTSTSSHTSDERWFSASPRRKVLQCEAVNVQRDPQNSTMTSGNNDTAARNNTFVLDPLLYQRMDLPDRANTDSHVIYGALLSDNLVESYHAYRHLQDRTRVTAVVQLGRGVDGHPGVVHGGVLALLMDDVLGFGYEALGDVPMAVTANLNVNYLQAVPAGACVLIRASLQQREGRKLYWKVQVVSSDDESVTFCEATSLFIIPREVYEQMISKKLNIGGMLIRPGNEE